MTQFCIITRATVVAPSQGCLFSCRDIRLLRIVASQWLIRIHSSNLKADLVAFIPVVQSVLTWIYLIVDE